MGKAVGDVVGTLTGTSGQDGAYKAQKKGTGLANAAMQTGYDEQAGMLSPYRQAGLDALAGLQDPNFGKNVEMDPGYRFGMDEGMKALQASSAAKGMGNSGAAMKAIQRFGSDYATTKYNDAYNRQSQRLGTLLGVGENANNTQINARGNLAQGIAGNHIGLANAKASSEIAKGQGVSNLIGQGIQGAAMYFSDENLKEDIRELSQEEITELANAVKACVYKYKDESHGEGYRIGVMAQDLQKSKLGRWVVSANADGHLMLDSSKLVQIITAVLPELAKGA